MDYDGLKNFLTDSNLVNELESLNEQEKQMLIQMAKEFSEKGSSNVLKSLWYEDYEEVPVDIDTFLDDPRYFGDVLEGSIYPYWREMLRNIFAPDSKYFEVIFSCLTGDTLISCTDGYTRQIKDIVKLVNEGKIIYINSYNRELGIYTVGRVINGVMNGCRTTWEIFLNNGKSFRATKEHKILMEDNEWKETEELQIGDKLFPNREGEKSREVIGKEYCAMLLPVYDIEVEITHNFISDCGCIFKNCSIGAGKSTIAGVGMAYVLYKLLCLKSPQKYYGLNKSSIMTMNFFNINLQLAETVSFGKFQSMITKSPWFLEHGTLVGKGKPQLVPNKGIKLAFGSNSSHALGQDVFCLSGDTKVLTEKGIKRLDELEGQSIQVFQYNPESNSIELSNLCSVIKSGEVKELIEIELEDRSIIKCTPEHRLMLANGEYRMAKDLTEEDELMYLDKI